MPMADFWLDMTALAGGGCATHPQREPVRAERVSWIEVSSVLRWVAGTGFGGRKSIELSAAGRMAAWFC